MSDVKTFYDKESNVYDSNRNYDLPEGAHNLYQQAIVSNLLGCTVESKCYLEAGVGTGRFAIEIAKKGHKIFVLDISEKMLKQTQKKAEKLGLADKIIPIQTDINNITLEDEVVDECICINVMSHIDTYQQALSELVRVLKPGGGITVNFPNLNGIKFPVGFLVNLRHKAIFQNVFTRWYNIKKTEQYLRSIGINITMYGGEPPALLKRFWPADSMVGTSFSFIQRFVSGVVFLRGEKSKH